MIAEGFKLAQSINDNDSAAARLGPLDWALAFVVIWIFHVCNPRRRWGDD